MADNTKEAIRRIVIDAGACRVGFAEAGSVDESDRKIFETWRAAGCHADMNYMERYDEVRFDPRLLLDGARTVISCAFDYRPAVRHRFFADYALGEDYHDVVRRRLMAAGAEICRLYGGEIRVCIDTAPVRERYWAVRAGVGSVGLNGLLIVDGIGSKVFLAELIWTGNVEPDKESDNVICHRCGKCVKACPEKALKGDGSLDARVCRSYLTIEHRGELPDGFSLDGRIYGCDICQDACPLNNTDGSSNIEEFSISEKLKNLGIDEIKSIGDDEFKEIFAHSAVRRTKAEGLRRNATASDIQSETDR